MWCAGKYLHFTVGEREALYWREICTGRCGGNVCNGERRSVLVWKKGDLTGRKGGGLEEGLY